VNNTTIREEGIPCVHTLVFNNGKVDFEDCHPRWFILTLAGEYDSIAIPKCGPGLVYTGPLLRVDAQAVKSSLSSIHCTPMNTREMSEDS
jgi:hypothetical protein